MNPEELYFVFPSDGRITHNVGRVFISTPQEALHKSIEFCFCFKHNCYKPQSSTFGLRKLFKIAQPIFLAAPSWEIALRRAATCSALIRKPLELSLERLYS
jgi:hypothetical protein